MQIMPQHGKRRVPFSGKRKKEQLFLKRQSNKLSSLNKNSSSGDDDSDIEEHKQNDIPNIKQLNKQPVRSNRNVNKYNLQFQEESKSELSEMKKAARLPFLSTTCDNPPQVEIDDSYFRGYDFPIRPKWHHNMTKEELMRSENRYFKEYTDNAMKRHAESSTMTSVFELNIETWRQLWRVIEMSDILLIVTDARYASLMFSPELFFYLVNTLKRNVILVLNKVDLISPEAALAWKYYFIEKYPGIHVVLFASYTCKQQQKKHTHNKRRRNVITECIRQIFEICKNVVNEDIDLISWEQKILEDSKIIHDEIQTEISFHTEETEIDCSSYVDTTERFKNGILTLGCIGFPNAGKSTLINSLKGRKVVSVSKTPGHTKHFQTIYLTENVKLCDSPGLVFPSRTPKYLQVLIGSFPIAQLREPYRSLVYVGERIDLAKVLGIKLPPDFDEWSAFSLCEAWCYKRGFLTAKASRPDYYRAANNLLRMVLDGKIVLQTYPPGFADYKEKWLAHSELDSVRKTQGYERTAQDIEQSSSEESESGDDVTRETSESDGNEANDHTHDKPCSMKYKLNQNLFNVLESE